MKLVDVHCHADEFKRERLKDFIDRLNMIIVGVGVDYKTSLKVLNYSRELNDFIPCIGVHPWYVNKVGETELKELIALTRDMKCIGEIGLDTRFASKTIKIQRKIFGLFLEIARENKAVLNIHSVDTWREVLELLVKHDINRAIFHWYTGPIDLLREINDAGYKISINPSVRFQKKHMKVLKEAPIEMIVTESDGPYQYRGYYLTPEMIPDTIKIIARVKGMDEEDVISAIYENFRELFLF